MLDQIPYIMNKYIVSANVFHVVYKLLYCFQIDASLAPLRHPLALLVATDFVINQPCHSQHTVMGASAVGLCMRALAPRAPFSTSLWSSFSGASWDMPTTYWNGRARHGKRLDLE